LGQRFLMRDVMGRTKMSRALTDRRYQRWVRRASHLATVHSTGSRQKGITMCKILPTILIVDDNENLRIALADIFLQFGHDVRTAADGFEALSVMRKKVPTVLISDLDMPGMSGLELLSVVRRRFPSVRVVAMSGAYSGPAVPTGIAADAFYAKGCGSLLF
jgi:CheY-like chemotaxis protein